MRPNARGFRLWYIMYTQHTLCNARCVAAARACARITPS